MPSLYVFDKDGTVVHPRNDGYVESPEDQVLYEGVRAKLDRLRAEGHLLAIASNQGGCDIFDCPARLLKDGMIWHNPPFMDSVFKIERTFDRVEDGEVSVYVRHVINPSHNESGIVLKSDFICKVSHKTIEGAIAEMQFAADLCGIESTYFAPTMNGDRCVHAYKKESEWTTLDISANNMIDNYRKPGPGMLTLISLYAYCGSDSQIDRRIMIGDRDSDRQAAIAAGFEFMWAEDWRNNEEDDRSGESPNAGDAA